MKFCVIANLTFETPAKRDSISQTISDKIAGKLIWGEVQSQKTISMDGLPSHNLLIRFENKTDMLSLFELIKDKMIQIPVLKGTISTHVCYHDVDSRPCVIDQKFEEG